MFGIESGSAGQLAGTNIYYLLLFRVSLMNFFLNILLFHAAWITREKHYYFKITTSLK